MTSLLDAEPAVLVLEDGRVFRGRSYGAVGETFGEAVFTTGMSGYQETITDPSYHRQVVVQTAPHIGNYGVNDDDAESRCIWVAGYVVRDPSRVASNWRSQRSLDDDLRDQGIVGISDVDTRALTRHLRERGAMRVGVFSGAAAARPGGGGGDRGLASPAEVGAAGAGEVSVEAAGVGGGPQPSGRSGGRGGALGGAEEARAQVDPLLCEERVELGQQGAEDRQRLPVGPAAEGREKGARLPRAQRHREAIDRR